MASLVSKAFPSVKLRRDSNPNSIINLKSQFPSSSLPPPTPQAKPILSLETREENSESSKSTSKSGWAVYLILSTNHPIKTYVGVTTNFFRRLKQHNGQVKGGAKAALAGRPWVSACIVRGFKDKSEACKFESKWKSLSRSLPRAKKNENLVNEIDRLSFQLLQHREAALSRMQTSFNFNLLEVDWKLSR